MEKKKKKLGLLPKLIIAIALGLIVGFACQYQSEEIVPVEDPWALPARTSAMPAN